MSRFGLARLAKYRDNPAAARTVLQNAAAIKENDLCPFRSGTQYKICRFPRTFLDLSKPNDGIPEPKRESFSGNRKRQPSPCVNDWPASIDTVDVGRTRLVCAPLPPFNEGEGPEKLLRMQMLSASGARTARESVVLTEAQLQAEIRTIEQTRNTRVLIYSETTGVARQEARTILANAEELTGGIPVNAVTHYDPASGQIIVVFRNNTVLRAEAFEEARHVLQFRQGGPFVAANPNDASAILTALQTRELDAAVHMRNLFREGRINVHEYHETVRNTAGYFNMSFQDMLRHVEAVR